MIYNLTLLQNIDKIKRFIFSGTIGALAHFFVLILCKEIFLLEVIPSTTIAFIVAGIVSFLLQKFWTFKNNSGAKIPYQMTAYFIVAFINVFLNGLLMNLLVNNLSVNYLISQIITSVFIAIESFIFYKNFVFRKNI